MIVISRKEAKKAGIPRYFTNKPCKHNHIAERYTCNHECVECDKVRKLKRKAKIKTKVIPTKNSIKIIKYKEVNGSEITIESDIVNF